MVQGYLKTETDQGIGFEGVTVTERVKGLDGCTAEWGQGGVFVGPFQNDQTKMMQQYSWLDYSFLLLLLRSRPES